jgi:hypothetical protein
VVSIDPNVLSNLLLGRFLNSFYPNLEYGSIKTESKIVSTRLTIFQGSPKELSFKKNFKLYSMKGSEKSEYNNESSKNVKFV